MDSEDRFSLARLTGLLGLVADDMGLVQPLESGWNAGQNPRTSASETATRSDVVVRGRDHCPGGAMCLGGWEKNDPDEPEDHALGRSRGGISSKIHILCDAQGHPLGVVATAGQVHESTALDTLLVQADRDLVDVHGDPVPWPVAMAGDKAYRADWIDDYVLALEIRPVIPSKENEGRDTRPVAFDRDQYRRRNIVERLIGWLKESRRVFARFEKTARNFLGMIKMAFIHRYLRLATK